MRSDHTLRELLLGLGLDHWLLLILLLVEGLERLNESGEGIDTITRLQALKESLCNVLLGSRLLQLQRLLNWCRLLLLDLRSVSGKLGQ